eukprot:Em0004g1416a
MDTTLLVYILLNHTASVLPDPNNGNVMSVSSYLCSAGVRGHHTDITESKKKKIGIVILLKSRRPECTILMHTCICFSK